MFGAFAEAVRATTQPCTLLLLAPVLAVVAATRCRWHSLAAALAAAVAGGWMFAAGWIVLDDVGIRITALAVTAALVALVVAPRVGRLAGAAATRLHPIAVAGVTLIATLWWRPCVGTELGVILTGARDGLAGQLPGMAAYMLGAMAPVALIVFAAHALGPRDRAVGVAMWVGATLGVAVAGALVIGRHDEVVVALTRLTTG